MRTLLTSRCHPWLWVLALLLPQSGFSDPSLTPDEPLNNGQVLTLAADPWCPYNCEPDSDFEGYLVDIARAVFAERNIDIHYINLPWRRALEFARQGVIDGVIGVVEGNQYGNAIGDQLLGYDETILITRKDDAFDYRGAASLANRRVGVITHYSYDNGGELDQFIEANADSVEVLYHEAALESLLLMLASDRIDVVLENRYVAEHKIANLRLGGRFALHATGVRNPVYIGFTPNAHGRQHARMLDEGLTELRASGELSALLNHYGLQDWQRTADADQPATIDDQWSAARP